MKKVVITFNIQSVTDIITNSSSEVFCTISGNTTEIQEAIYNRLRDLITDSCSYPDMGWSMTKGAPIFDEDYNKIGMDEGKLQIHLSYDGAEFEVFLKAGLEAILEREFPGTYTIGYEENY